MTSSIIDSYLNKSDWRVNENSNVGYSLQGLNVYLTNEVIKEYWLNSVLPRTLSDLHRSGDLHIHNLGNLCMYCCGWDLGDLLSVGFRGAPGKVESGPAKHFSVALMQIVNFLFTLQGESAGANSFSSVDTYVAPFIRKDNLSYKEVKQYVQEFIYNLNVPTRIGGQSPFTTITIDLTIPKHMRNVPVIIGGVDTGTTYGEYQEESNMFNKAFAEVMIEGDYSGKPFSFPIPTYSITDDFDWDNESYMNIWQSASKFGIPNFANFINSGMDPSDVRSMCCHLRLHVGELKRMGGGLFGAYPLTGSQSIITINLPRIGYQCSGKDDFISRLSSIMDSTKDILTIKRNKIEELMHKGLYPYSKYYLRKICDSTGNYLSNHFSTIGIIGMHDALINMNLGGIDTDEGLSFAGDVLDFMRNKMSLYQEETGNMFNLEATPAEGTSYSLAQKDMLMFPEIKIAAMIDGGSSVPYYTNSTSLPPYKKAGMSEALRNQSKLLDKYTGGSVFHAFLGESMPDPVSIKSLVRTISTKYSVPYFSITPTFSICKDHGYMSGNVPSCPICYSSTDVYSRIVGYLRPVSQWHVGKRAEFAHRNTFRVQ